MSFYPDTNIQGELLAPDHVAQKMMSRGSRAEMEKFAAAGELPSEIRELLYAGKLRLADRLHYSVKLVKGEKTIKMFESQDVEETGLRSISHGKLPHQEIMMLSGIYVMAGITQAAGPTPTDDELKQTSFGSLLFYPQITNGTFEMKVNKTQIIPPTGNLLWVTDNNHNWSMGYYKLDNPRLIHPQMNIEAEFSLPVAATLPPNTAIYLGLHGTVTTP